MVIALVIICKIMFSEILQQIYTTGCSIHIYKYSIKIYCASIETYDSYIIRYYLQL